MGQTGDPLQVAAVSLTGDPIFILWLLRICWYGGSAVASIAIWRTEVKADETGVGVYYLCFSGGRCFLLRVHCLFLCSPFLILVWSE